MAIFNSYVSLPEGIRDDQNRRAPDPNYEPNSKFEKGWLYKPSGYDIHSSPWKIAMFLK